MAENEQPGDGGKANIGVVGLAVMGSNLARNLASREGNTVAVYNRTYARTQELVDEHGDMGFIASEDIDGFVASLAKPRTAIIMVQAGKGTDAVIGQLAERFEEGDIIVDGGNANFHDTIRREHDLRDKGLNFVGTGISGGEEGALKGPSIMPGGSDEAWETLGPILKSIAAVAEGEPCVTHVGTDGAGHFVKMVHNGIEYADMQLIAESYDLLRRVGRHSTDDLVKVFEQWNEGDLESYLIEITGEVLKQQDPESGKALVDVIRDEAGSKGTGVWTVQNAVGLGVPVSGIGEAVFARAVSSKPSQRAAVQQAFPDRPDVVDVPDGFEDDVRAALYASKVVAYAQGFDLIIAGRRSTTGTSRSVTWRRSGAAGASSARSSSTASSRRTTRTPSSSRCWWTRTSPTRSRRARPPGVASSGSLPPRASPHRASRPRSRTSTRSRPTGSPRR